MTKDESLSWQSCLLWVIGMMVAGFFVTFVTGVGLLHMDNPFPEILGIVASFLALVVILWHQGIRPAHVWIITGLYVFVRFGILLLMLLFRTV